ncbi:MAG: molybdenum cofactor guanylyltransferase [Alkalimonas sp.]|nr:molybdenum cofactor guanylyltransferase [Alkalimonas sp.]
MTPKQSFSCILLAGGKSSRMGKDKADLNWHGQPLWQHMSTLATKAGARQVIVSRNASGFLPDRFAAAGPLAGIEVGLRRSHEDRVLVLAIDTPLLRVTDIQQLVAVSTNKAVCFASHPLPCVLPNSLAVHRYLQRVLKQAHSDRSVQALLTAIGFESCQPTHSAVLCNANTPDEWQQALNYASKELHHG